MLLAGCPLDKARQIADDVCQAVADHHFVWKDQSLQHRRQLRPRRDRQRQRLDRRRAVRGGLRVLRREEAGRGRIHVYSARDEVLARERGEIQWLQRLQRALKENGFELYAQPIVRSRGARRRAGGRGPAADAGRIGREHLAVGFLRRGRALPADVARRSLGRADHA